jgi:NADH-quinone oxidoreductase subunit J
MRDILFHIAAIALILFSIGVVTARNMLHAAIFLVQAFVATAILYLLMYAEFAAIMQLAVYIGGIVVVIVFIILLTSELGEAYLETSWRRRLPAWPLAIACIGLWLAHGRLGSLSGAAPTTERFASIDTIAHFLLATDGSGYLVPFEILSILLLAAVIGAMVVARRHHDAPTEKQP